MRTQTLRQGLVLLVLAAAASPAAAQVLGSKPWNTAGSAGILDGVNVNKADFHPYGWVEILGDESTVTLRYPVTAVDGLLETAGPLLTRTQMRVTFRDQDETTLVTATLKEYNPTLPTAPPTHLMGFSSNNYPGSASLQTRTVGCGFEPFAFDFVNRVYFIEATLRRFPGGPRPALAAIQLQRVADNCIVP
jgi:hypothetical protein